MERNNKIMDNKGITLVALIITIIVILILTAITINVATDGSLIEKAQNAVDTTNDKIQQEGENSNQILDWIALENQNIIAGNDSAGDDSNDGDDTTEEPEVNTNNIPQFTSVVLNSKTVSSFIIDA